MKFILGTKKNMTQIFDDKGLVKPATVIEAGPVVVTQIKTKEVDGYNAIQVGFGTKKEKNINRFQFTITGQNSFEIINATLFF